MPKEHCLPTPKNLYNKSYLMLCLNNIFRNFGSNSFNAR